MKFLKSYWWVFALLIGGFLIYWFMFRDKTAVASGQKIVCNNTKAEWDQKMVDTIAAIKNDSSWLASVQAQVTSQKYADIDKALYANADYFLRVNQGQCNPYYSTK